MLGDYFEGDSIDVEERINKDNKKKKEVPIVF